MKKFLAILLVVVLTAAISVGVTLAYLTDRDNATNVFTMGNVDIKLNNGFDQGVQLVPGKTVTEPVTITNTGKNDAWVWYTVALENMPAAAMTYTADGNWTKNADGVELYPSILKAGQSVTVNVTLSLSAAVDVDPNGDMHLVVGGEVTDLEWNVNNSGNPVAYLNAYGIQAESFATVEAAYSAYIGQWGQLNGEKAEPATVTEVASAAELAQAVAAGGVVVLNNDVVLADQPMTITQDTVINLNGKTLSGTSSNASASKLLNVTAGSTLTLSNGTVSFEAGLPDTDWGDNNASRPYPGYASNTINLSGKLIIDGATIENKTAPGGASYAIDCYPGADLVINSGKIDGCGKVAVRTFANSATNGINVTVNGGEISGYRAFWIHLPGSNADVMPPVTLTMNGGTLESTDATYNQAIYSYSYGNNASGTTINLLGGTVYGDVAVGGGTKNGAETVNISDNVSLYGNAFRYTSGGEEPIKITNTVKVETAEAFKTAAAAGGTILLAEGTYTMPAGTSQDVTIVGTKDTVINLPAKSSTSNGNTITLKGVTVQGVATEGSWYTEQFNGAEKIVYEDCTINGLITVYEDTEFIGCEFVNTFTNEYSVYCYDGDKITFTDCTFNSKCGKAVKVYDEGNGTRTVTLTGCDFYAENAKKAAVEIDSTYNTYYVYINDCTVSGQFTALWNSDADEDTHTNVCVDGVWVKGNAPA